MGPRGVLARLGRSVRRALPRRLRFNVATRITLGFALGGLVLSLVVTTITYVSTRASIVNEEIASIEQTAVGNVVNVEEDLRHADPTDYPAIFAELNLIDSNSNSSSLLYSSADPAHPWTFTYKYSIGDDQLPASLKQLVVNGGTSGEQTFSVNGVPYAAVGFPVPRGRGAYFAVFPLSQAAHTLDGLLAALLLASALTILAGAVLGWWASRMTLRPLREVTRAATDIAGGRLDTRIEIGGPGDLARLASSFNRMVDRLRQRLERDARFTSDVSHELRSPLTTLATSLSVLETRREELPERSRQALDLLSAEVERFARLVRDLLEISSIDAGSAPFEESAVSVGELVAASVRNAGGEIPIVMDEATADARLTVDKRRFERIMTNLFVNADRYAGGATRVTAEADDTSVRIAVEDEGPGIPSEEREHIFERFARGSRVAGTRGDGRGTGLGLALVTEHARLHGGTVWVESNEPAGSRFVVELPRRPVEIDEDEEEDGGEADDADSPASPAAPGADGNGSKPSGDAPTGPPPGRWHLPLRAGRWHLPLRTGR